MTNLVRTVPGRQEKIVAIQELTFEDINASGEVTLFQIPSGSIVTGGHVNVSTAFTDATTLTLDVGISGGDIDIWTPTIIDLKTAGGTALDVTTTAGAADKATVFTAVAGTVTLTGTAPTAGAVEVVLEYAMSGRSCFTHGELIQTP